MTTIESNDGLVQMTWTARCPPDTKWMRVPSGQIVAVGVFLLMAMGGILGLGAAITVERSGYVAPVELSDTERHTLYLEEMTTPRTIKLRIADEAEFKDNLGSALRSHNVAAYAQFGNDECKITIPSGWKIKFNPRSGGARWVNDDNGNILAHEILHCLRGRWHPQE